MRQLSGLLLIVIVLVSCLLAFMYLIEVRGQEALPQATDVAIVYDRFWDVEILSYRQGGVLYRLRFDQVVAVAERAEAVTFYLVGNHRLSAAFGEAELNKAMEAYEQEQ